MKDAGFHSLSSLADTDCDRLNWNLHLPAYAPTDRIGFQLDRFNRLARIGGFASVNVVGYDGQSQSVQAGFNGVDASGEATASMRTTVQKSQLQEVTMSSTSLAGYFADRECTIRINTSHMTDMIQASKSSSPLRSPVAWSRVLDGAVGGGLRRATFKNIVSDARISSKLLFAMYPGLFAQGVIVDPIHWENVIGVQTAYLAGSSFVYNGLRMWLGKYSHNDAPFGILPFINIDRVATVAASTKLRPLIKPLQSL